ncbi:MAG: methyltransferase domain-containing protein [Chitinophagaceae bacterium]|nr:methyltransferase domain-containing protein [Chitinophagaceae bacterium]
MDYSRRSYKKELLDSDDIPFADIQQNMAELDFINTCLGGHSITLSGIKKFLQNRKSITVCEIGCGGGDNLNAIYKYCSKKIDTKLIGIDINADCISFARKNTPIANENFIVSDYRMIDFKKNKPDVIFSSLFCHHFSDEQLLEMLLWMQDNSRLGFFINDLHRHPLAFRFIKFSTRLFSKSYLVKNDAPLSVLRGFKNKEWISLLQKAGIKNYSIEWKWAFRYLITVLNDRA